MLRRPFLVAVVAGLLVGGCSPSDDATSGETTTTTVVATTATTAPTTTVASTTTSATTTTVAAATTTEALPEGEDSGPGDQWDLVWISDSLGFGVARAWADLIEEAEGVEVRVHNHATPNLSLVQVREWLTDDSSDSDDELRGQVADAEIVFVFGNPTGTGSDDKGCYPWPETYPEPPEPATPADWAQYGDVLRDILDAVFDLRAGQPTVIRVAHEWAAPIASWRAAGIEAICTASWEAQAQVVREAGDKYGVATASWYDAFNGPDHDEDPYEKGYIGPDVFHQSGEGIAVQAEVLHALGYEPIVPNAAWTRPDEGIRLAVEPASVPGTAGPVDVEVTVVDITGGYTGISIFACPEQHGEVAPPSATFTCTFDDNTDLTQVEPIPATPFTVPLTVHIDESIIRDGGVTLTAGDIFIPYAGAVLLTVTK